MKEKFLKFILNPKYIFGVYLIIAVVTAVSKYLRGDYAINNYLIFKHVFFNTVSQKNLFIHYPDFYFDLNHYGIFFSLLIAPFAVMPDWLGISLWNLANTFIFVYAIYKLPFSDGKKALFGLLCLQEYITAALSLQFNIALTGLLILSAVYIYEKKEVKSVTAILIGVFVKIYGIVGLTQFFFIKNKTKFILSGLVIAVLFFAVPMIYSSPQFVMQSYADWFHSIIEKNNENQVLGNMQDISLMGFFRRILGDASISNLVFLGFGLPLFAAPYIRIKQYKSYAFQLMILSSTLLFLVLFSSSSESPTYIIAVVGVMIWFFLQKERTPFIIGLLVFVIIFTCFSTSDLFPKSVKNDYIIKYSLKAVPCIIVWLRVVYELLTKDFEKNYSLK
ncbi:membrane protein YdbS with pleckstrin-like domain [Chryseobacterium sp. H1D6B]|uniref:glycosyltransferase family 87 protein n=1 Tax=Chryseobacterium sp. H1D6B TaxID=2940588 RepID=UPI0015CC34E8|nr:glycosyltransferase family 87 protein [Chryseobacterium sp. H1D6B]MDH6253687.1 membrane protein YdbS with pleckstrin-like domain [Chryseobacterium sp. H1D6B]